MQMYKKFKMVSDDPGSVSRTSTSPRSGLCRPALDLPPRNLCAGESREATASTEPDAHHGSPQKPSPLLLLRSSESLRTLLSLPDRSHALSDSSRSLLSLTNPALARPRPSDSLRALLRLKTPSRALSSPSSLSRATLSLSPVPCLCAQQDADLSEPLVDLGSTKSLPSFKDLLDSTESSFQVLFIDGGGFDLHDYDFASFSDGASTLHRVPSFEEVNENFVEGKREKLFFLHLFLIIYYISFR